MAEIEFVENVNDGKISDQQISHLRYLYEYIMSQSSKHSPYRPKNFYTRVEQQLNANTAWRYFLQNLINDNILGSEIYIKDENGELKQFLPIVLCESFENRKKVNDKEGEKSTNGEYAQDVITINTDRFYDLKTGQDLLVNIATIGHEFEHWLQDHIILEEFTDEQKLEYYTKLKQQFDREVEPKDKIDSQIDNIVFDDNLFSICYRYKDQNNLADFLYKTYKAKGKNSFAKIIHEEEYFSRIYEEDARYKGIIFVDLVLNKFINDYRVQKDEELYNWLVSLRDSISKDSRIIENYDDALSYYGLYDRFNLYVSDISKDMMFELAKSHKKENRKITKETAYSALLNIYFQKTFEGLTEQEKCSRIIRRLKVYHDDLMLIENSKKEISKGKYNLAKETIAYVTQKTIEQLRNIDDTSLKEISEILNELVLGCPKEYYSSAKILYNNEIISREAFEKVMDSNPLEWELESSLYSNKLVDEYKNAISNNDETVKRFVYSVYKNLSMNMTDKKSLKKYEETFKVEKSIEKIMRGISAGVIGYLNRDILQLNNNAWAQKYINVDKHNNLSVKQYLDEQSEKPKGFKEFFDKYINSKKENNATEEELTFVKQMEYVLIETCKCYNKMHEEDYTK